MKGLIPAIVCFKGSSWYCYQHKMVMYTGDVLNTAKILSDSDCEEIAIMNLDHHVPKYILDIPKHITRPISISGGINNMEDARRVIRSGFDRIGLTYPFKSNPGLPEILSKELGESTLAINIRPNSSEELNTIFDDIHSKYRASEYIIHDVESAGSLNGLSNDFKEIICELKDDNYALSGGFAGEDFSGFRVYYSTKFMFPLSQGSSSNSLTKLEKEKFLVSTFK